MPSSYQTSKLQIKDFTNLRFVSEALGFSEASVMLSDREKLILHFVSMMTIAKMTNVHYHKKVLEPMIEDVRKNRCRSIAPEDVVDIVEEINEELLAGKIMFEQRIGDLKWSLTGERPNKNTNWRDMR
jgi:hypothetical protein